MNPFENAYANTYRHRSPEGMTSTPLDVVAAPVDAFERLSSEMDRPARVIPELAESLARPRLIELPTYEEKYPEAHPCGSFGCSNTSQFADEPYCYSHTAW